jgi:ABC-type branched-subunit amino acid transport system substrate-binding protein
MRRTQLLAAALVVAAVSACGTTVPMSQQASGSTGVSSTGGLGAPGTTGVGGATGSGLGGGQLGGPAGSAVGLGGGSSSATSTATGPGLPGGSTGGAGGSGGKLSGRGFTATTLTIGVPMDQGTSAVANSMGISGAASVSAKDLVDAAIAEVNRTGGILGRKVSVYYHYFDTASYIANPSPVVAEMCTDFRDDHHVFAVLFTLPSPDLRDCLAQMGTPLMGGDGGTSVIPEKQYAAHGGNYFYAPQAITVETLARLFISSLMARNFHEKWNINTGEPGGVAPVKLGVIHADSPDVNALYAAYAKELAKYGLKFTDSVTYTASVQAGLAATQNAVLKFAADGITHVYGASAFFLKDAQNQGYHPRYAYLPGLGELGAENVPAEQMKGAMTVGWEPTNDVNQAQDPGPTAGAAPCRAVMRKAGITSDARADLQSMYTVCDLINVFKASLVRGGSISVAGFRKGFESLGSTFPMALTFNATMGPNHHYGVDAVRDMAWDSACPCLKYTSKTYRR